MKKILLSLMIVSGSFASAQTLAEENFNGLLVGNLSTETTGTTAGQGDYFLFSNNGTAPTTSTNSGVTNAQNWISLTELSSLDKFKEFLHRIGIATQNADDPEVIKRYLDTISKQIMAKNPGY